MCGICGIFEFDQARVVSAAQVHAMNQTIRHRGPDDDGVYVNRGIGFGHRRLSIIDVAGGHQPLSNEDGTIWVLVNGEIYNYPELREELLARGHRLSTRSDIETVVHLYEDYGEACFAKLRGMFAIALWDSRDHKLLLARDRAGEKPLFYYHDADRLVFGSELKAVLAGPGVSVTTDNEALFDYFSFGYVPAPKSIYREVRKVLPGHYMVVSRDGLRDVCYWDLEFHVDENRTEAEWCEALRHQLCESTRIQLMSDVPLGAFLSGGVDSSSVVAMMRQVEKNGSVTTCSIAFEEDEYNEAPYARRIAEQFHTDHFEKTVRPQATEIIDKLAWHYDEPFADSSAIPTYYVSAVAREKVTVALGGDGGDENFAGYRRYAFDQMENRLRSFVPAAVRRPIFGPLGRIYPALAWAPRVFRGKATFQSLSRSPLEGYFNSLSIFRPDEKPQLFTGDFLREMAGYDSISVFQKHYDNAGTDDPLTKIQYVDIKTYLPDDILVKVDRASMAVSLEVRAPLLDHRLMELAASIPSRLKLKGMNGKYILKKAMSSILPHDVLYRPKQGFAVPLDHWFRKEIKEMAYENIIGQTDGILDPKLLKKIWNQHQSGQYDRSAHLWAILMYRKWMNGSQATETVPSLAGVHAYHG
jgi:asparagine synthase (glutamine-hydrolysing)